jgi:hypothetical protein
MKIEASFQQQMPAGQPVVVTPIQKADPPPGPRTVAVRIRTGAVAWVKGLGLSAWPNGAPGAEDQVFTANATMTQHGPAWYCRGDDGSVVLVLDEAGVETAA